MDTYLIFDPEYAPDAKMAKNAIDARECYMAMGKNARALRVTIDYPVIEVTADFYEECYPETTDDDHPDNARAEYEYRMDKEA